MLDIEPGRTSRLRLPYPDKLQQIIDVLKKRYSNIGPALRRLKIIAEIDRMNLTIAEKREILRRLRYKKPVRSV